MARGSAGRESASGTSARSRAAADGTARRLTGLQLESWRLLWQELARDPEAMAECRDWQRRRELVRPQMVELLRRFLDGTTALQEVRATFDLRTRTSWDAFGLRGLSGAMFLNRLAGSVPDAAALAARLREALPAPRDAAEARLRLGAFTTYLDELTRGGTVARRHLQPARATFFVTSWWHVQDVASWPAFQPSARRALQGEEDLYVPIGDAVADYFAFREVFLALAAALGRTTWELEYLCWWHEHRERPAEVADYYEPGRHRAPREARERAARIPVVSEPAPRAATGAPPTALEHTHVQWLLCKIGRRLGCRVWVAANDRKRAWRGETLASLSIPRLPPLGLDPDSQRIITLIDVVWLKGANQVAAAFEVEHTTSVYSGLLRLADLAALSPNLNFPLYIVAPSDRLDKVRRELSRPTFQMLELHRRCAFFASEALVDAADNIMRWAHTPAAIDRLARRVDEVPEGGVPG